MADTLRTHDIHLIDGVLHLRPMTEDDWAVLYGWNNDPEVLYYTEGDDITLWDMDDMQTMYREVSRRAYMFMIEVEGCAIGECWLQEMNIERVLRHHPGQDVRRVDLMIGDKAWWGKGWGTRVIALLTRFAFECCGADLVYAVEIGGHNPRSRRAFEKNGYRLVRAIERSEGKSTVVYDLALAREGYEARIALPNNLT
ncbi:MAG TPA: GNAT family N-acetyltransferase [Chloroflexi bacterium]|nr:GNAT family N-acetyltransferase [Chloroflexota bacterium]